MANRYGILGASTELLTIDLNFRPHLQGALLGAALSLWFVVTRFDQYALMFPAALCLGGLYAISEFRTGPRLVFGPLVMILALTLVMVPATLLWGADSLIPTLVMVVSS